MSEYDQVGDILAREAARKEAQNGRAKAVIIQEKLSLLDSALDKLSRISKEQSPEDLQALAEQSLSLISDESKRPNVSQLEEQISRITSNIGEIMTGLRGLQIDFEDASDATKSAIAGMQTELETAQANLEAIRHGRVEINRIQEQIQRQTVETRERIIQLNETIEELLADDEVEAAFTERTEEKVERAHLEQVFINQGVELLKSNWWDRRANEPFPESFLREVLFRFAQAEKRRRGFDRIEELDPYWPEILQGLALRYLRITETGQNKDVFYAARQYIKSNISRSGIEDRRGYLIGVALNELLSPDDRFAVANAPDSLAFALGYQGSEDVDPAIRVSTYLPQIELTPLMQEQVTSQIETINLVKAGAEAGALSIARKNSGQPMRVLNSRPSKGEPIVPAWLSELDRARQYEKFSSFTTFARDCLVELDQQQSQRVENIIENQTIRAMFSEMVARFKLQWDRKFHTPFPEQFTQEMVNNFIFGLIKSISELSLEQIQRENLLHEILNGLNSNESFYATLKGFVDRERGSSNTDRIYNYYRLMGVILRDCLGYQMIKEGYDRSQTTSPVAELIDAQNYQRSQSSEMYHFLVSGQDIQKQVVESWHRLIFDMLPALNQVMSVERQTFVAVSVFDEIHSAKTREILMATGFKITNDGLIVPMENTTGSFIISEETIQAKFEEDRARHNTELAQLLEQQASELLQQKETLETALGPDGIFAKIKVLTEKLKALKKIIEELPKKLRRAVTIAENNCAAVTNEGWFSRHRRIDGLSWEERLDDTAQKVTQANNILKKEDDLIDEKWHEASIIQEEIDNLGQEMRQLPGNPKSEEEARQALQAITEAISKLPIK